EFGKEEDAETALRQALKLRTELATQFGNALEYRRELARTYNDLGCLLDRREKDAGAEKAYRQALGLEEKLVKDSGAKPVYRQTRARTGAAVGGCLRKHNRCVEAEEVLNRAVKIQEDLCSTFSHPRLRRELADSYQGLGKVLADLKRETEAEAAFRRG